MSSKKDNDIRAILLTVIEEQQPKGSTGASLQESSVLDTTVRRLGNSRGRDTVLEQAILTQWHELFRTGYLAWGFNICNPRPPFFHLTTQGKKALAQLSRDPSNPAGYLKHVYSVGELSPVIKSYLEEGLDCYVAGLYKASAVMVGGASEAIILQLANSMKKKLNSLGRPAVKNLNTWQVKKILSALKSELDKEKIRFPESLKDELEYFWPAFTQQIRAARNDAGHPSNIEPIKPDTVHASLLIFPELSKLANSLEDWIIHKMQ